MACERIASEGSPVSFADGTSSAGKAGNFHELADGAGIVPSTDPSNPGGYYYVSNSERGSGNGGGMCCYLSPHKSVNIHAMPLTLILKQPEHSSSMRMVKLLIIWEQVLDKNLIF